LTDAREGQGDQSGSHVIRTRFGNVLKNPGLGLQDKIVHNLGNFTIALLGIWDAQKPPDLAGTGTLMSVDGSGVSIFRQTSGFGSTCSDSSVALH